MIDISYSKDSEEIMVRYPSGRIEFLSTWEAIKLLWSLAWTTGGQKYTVRINGEVL